MGPTSELLLASSPACRKPAKQRPMAKSRRPPRLPAKYLHLQTSPSGTRNNTLFTVESLPNPHTHHHYHTQPPCPASPGPPPVRPRLGPRCPRARRPPRPRPGPRQLTQLPPRQAWRPPRPPPLPPAPRAPASSARWPAPPRTPAHSPPQPNRTEQQHVLTLDKQWRRNRLLDRARRRQQPERHVRRRQQRRGRAHAGDAGAGRADQQQHLGQQLRRRDRAVHQVHGRPGRQHADLRVVSGTTGMFFFFFPAFLPFRGLDGMGADYHCRKRARLPRASSKSTLDGWMGGGRVMNGV